MPQSVPAPRTFTWPWTWTRAAHKPFPQNIEAAWKPNSHPLISKLNPNSAQPQRIPIVPELTQIKKQRYGQGDNSNHNQRTASDQREDELLAGLRVRGRKLVLWEIGRRR